MDSGFPIWRLVGGGALFVTLLIGGLLYLMLRYRGAWHASLQEQQRLHAKLTDYAELGCYRHENASIANSAKSRVVFLGDSITRRWALKDYFPGLDVLNRGIGWQTTSEMLGRFRQDVIELHPNGVVILGGSNDFHPASGPSPLEVVIGNIKTMVELAQIHNIRAFVGTIPPMNKTQLSTEEANGIAWNSISEYNTFLRNYCDGIRCTLLDFDRSFQASGKPLKQLLEDGTHPTPLGYACMAKEVTEALARGGISHELP